MKAKRLRRTISRETAAPEKGTDRELRVLCQKLWRAYTIQVLSGKASLELTPREADILKGL